MQTLTPPSPAEDDALHPSRRYLKAIFENSLDGILVTDDEGRYLDANPAACALLGYTHDELTRLSILDITPPAQRQEGRARWQQFLARGSQSGEYSTMRKDGAVIEVEYRAVANIMAGVHVASCRDTTVHKRIEEALRESERFRRMIIASEPECVMLVAADYSLLDMNPAGLEMIEATSLEQVQGQSVLNLIPPECRTTFMEMHKRVLQGESVVTEFQMGGLKGSHRWLESHAAPLLDKESVVIAQLSITRDITARKRAEDRLKQSERQLAEAQSIAHIGSWSWDISSETQVWSDELYRIYGLAPGQVPPTHEAFLELVHPDDRTRLNEVVGRSFSTRSATVDIHLRIVRREGEERIIQSRAFILYDDQGTPIRLSGTAQDVTEHWRSQEALRQAEQKYRDIFENALEGIFQTSVDGQFIVANPALAGMFGFDSPEELTRERADISKQHYVDPRRRDEFKRLLKKEGVVHNFEYEAFRKDGSRIWVSDNVRAIHDESGKLRCYEGIVTDITERKRAGARTAAFATLAGKLSGARVPLSAAQTIADTAQELFGWDSCALKLYDANRDLLFPLLYIDTVGGQLKDVTPEVSVTKPAPRSRRVIDHGAQLTLREEPYRFDDDSVPFGDLDRPSVSVMSVPIRHASRVIGILSIQSYQPHAYDHEALADLQALADHCGAALNRIKAEEALRESEERYRELFENAKDAMYVHDLKGRYISVNRAAEKLSGHSREEIIGRTFSDFVPPDQIEIVTEHLCRKLVEEGETGYETEVIAQDGRRVSVEISSHLIYQNGVSVGVQGTARDITERRRAEERLREYEKVVEGLEEMIVVVDRDFRYLLANRAFLKYRGLEREEVVGRLVPDLLDKDIFDDLVKHKLEQAFRGQVVSYEMKFSYPQLGERDLLISYFPIESPTGIDRAACVLQDITERKRAEEALRKSEERFSKAFHSSPTALSLTQLEDGRVFEVNEAFLRMTGFSRSEVIGRTTIELGLWTSGSREAMAQEVRERGTAENLEIKFKKKSGEIREGLLSAELISLDTGLSVLGMAQDVTERNRAAEALQSYPRQLIEAQEAERKNIARELHDQIGQVLTAIQLNLQTVLEACETSPARTLVDEGIVIVDEALAQVRDLSFELRPALLDDLGLVTALRWYADRFAQRTGIRVMTAIDLPESSHRLRQELETACFRIVQEALTNVARHARAGSVSITMRGLEDQIRLSITDDGTGFDVHSQNHASFTGRVGIRGMRERALALGGRLEVMSSPARGTEIRAHFPGESLAQETRYPHES